MSTILEKISAVSNVQILANNLKFLMHTHHIDSASLSAQTGITVTTINCLRRGAGNPTIATLALLADVFKVSIGQLLEENLSGLEKYGCSQRLKGIPLVTFAEFNDFIEHKKNYQNTLIVFLEPFKAENCYSIKLTNNSMTPFFEKGCIFVISIEIAPHDGDLVVVQFDENTTCIRKVFFDGNAYFFQSMVNNLEGKIKKEDIFKIHGVVIKTIQNYYE